MPAYIPELHDRENVRTMQNRISQKGGRQAMKEITRVFTVEVTQIEVVEDDLADKLTDEGGLTAALKTLLIADDVHMVDHKVFVRDVEINETE